MFGFIENKINQKQEKEIAEKRKQAQKHMVWQELQERDRNSHNGYLLGYISMKYTYLNKEYSFLNYRINYSGNLVIGNKDFDVIFCGWHYESLIEFLTKLKLGEYSKI